MSTEVRDNKVGTVVDQRYRLDEVIGTGAMGKVYRGTQLAVGRDVAIKVLRTDVEIEPRYQRRFETEAKAVARLTHPGIVTLHDFGYSFDQNLFYMVFEYLEGENLADLVEERELRFDLVAKICLQIATALHHAHQADVMHRDLKPSNVMLVDEEGRKRVKILDFGLALTYGQDEPVDDGEASQETDRDQRRLSQDGEVRGTPAYMSPEQCRGRLDIDGSTDVYALGCMMFEILEGRLPYEYEDILRILEGHTKEPIPEMTNTSAPEKIRQLIHRMLAKERDARATMPEVIDVLSGYADVDASMEFDIPREADTSQQVSLTSVETERTSSWQSFAAALLVTAVIIFIAGYVLFL